MTVARSVTAPPVEGAGSAASATTPGVTVRTTVTPARPATSAPSVSTDVTVVGSRAAVPRTREPGAGAGPVPDAPVGAVPFGLLSAGLGAVLVGSAWAGRHRRGR